jgi:hypothetical protein
MLRAGDALRFTPDEIEAYRRLGLDFDGARTGDDVEQALTRWAGTLNEERPDLLEKIAVEMAKPSAPSYPRAWRECPDAALQPFFAATRIQRSAIWSR